VISAVDVKRTPPHRLVSGSSKVYPCMTVDPDPRRWKALALLCTAFFMVILDSAIVIVALPSIEQDLGFPSAGDLQWVLSAYLLSFGGLLERDAPIPQLCDGSVDVIHVPSICVNVPGEAPADSKSANSPLAPR
jgi:hypothetical protein